MFVMSPASINGYTQYLQGQLVSIKNWLRASASDWLVTVI